MNSTPSPLKFVVRKETFDIRDKLNYHISFEDVNSGWGSFSLFSYFFTKFNKQEAYNMEMFIENLLYDDYHRGDLENDI